MAVAIVISLGLMLGWVVLIVAGSRSTYSGWLILVAGMVGSFAGAMIARATIPNCDILMGIFSIDCLLASVAGALVATLAERFMGPLERILHAIRTFRRPEGKTGNEQIMAKLGLHNSGKGLHKDRSEFTEGEYI